MSLGFWHPAHLIATWGGAGLLRHAPGSWGSLAALPFAYGLQAGFGPVGLALTAIVLFAAGCWATGVYLDAVGGRDPPAVVVDEVVGQWLTLLPAALDPMLYLAGFAFFRGFDIIKPWPIGLAERRIPGAYGVMLDDVFAGMYAGLLLFAFARFLEAA